MEIGAIIQARSTSSRLPGKVTKPLLGKPVLYHIVNRVSLTKLIDKVVVATTINKEDDLIADICKEKNFLLFRGSENDVLDRYYRCASEYKINHIVRITADCPLHDPNVIDTIVKEYIDGDYDYVSNTIEYTFPDGFDVEVFSFKALKEAWEKAKMPSEREHVTPYIRNNKNFKTKNVFARTKYPLYRLTLDYPEDYEFIKRIYEGIGKEMFYFQDILQFLEKNPEILELNQHHDINEGYEKTLEEDEKYKKKSNL